MMKTVLGLTGGSGSGKSLAAAYLEKKGAYIIDADKIAKNIMEPGHPALLEVAQAFTGVLTDDGRLNRKALAEIVFSDPEALKNLNRITHAYIIRRIKDMVAQSGKDFLVIDAPLLYESGLDKICTACLCVTAERDKRINRIMSRDNLTEQEATSRIDAQHKEEYFLSRGAMLMENNGDRKALEGQLDIILKELNIETP